MSFPILHYRAEHSTALFVFFRPCMQMRYEAILAFVHSKRNQMGARAHRSASLIKKRRKIIYLTVGGAVIPRRGQNLLPAHMHQPVARGGMWLSEF
jgi:hypothetical protein